MIWFTDHIISKLTRWNLVRPSELVSKVHLLQHSEHQPLVSPGIEVGWSSSLWCFILQVICTTLLLRGTNWNKRWMDDAGEYLSHCMLWRVLQAAYSYWQDRLLPPKTSNMFCMLLPCNQTEWKDRKVVLLTISLAFGLHKWWHSSPQCILMEAKQA